MKNALAKKMLNAQLGKLPYTESELGEGMAVQAVQKKSVSQTQAKVGTSSIKAAVSRRLASPPVQGFHCSIKVSSPKLVDRKTKLRKFREHVKSHAATGQLF